ncbi:hypothetical protein X924_02655 [Petrotoga sp. 9PWA.NaAc.5.4]|nr:hypothetical protein X924_02655 [Petrotoga sp. 9PWA.NaAc.5.4]
MFFKNDILNLNWGQGVSFFTFYLAISMKELKE